MTASSCSDKASCRPYVTCCSDCCCTSRAWCPELFPCSESSEPLSSWLATSPYYLVSLGDLPLWRPCPHFRSRCLSFRWVSGSSSRASTHLPSLPCLGQPEIWSRAPCTIVGANIFVNRAQDKY